MFLDFDKIPLGIHISRNVSRKEGLIDAIERTRVSLQSIDVKMNAVAFFVAGPRRRSFLIREEDAMALRAYLNKQKILAIAHGTYLDTPWQKNPVAISFIHKELLLCQKAGISGLVIHLPKLPPETVIKTVPLLIPPVWLKRSKNNGEPKTMLTKLYLETPAVSPKNAFYETPEKLVKLFSSLFKRDPKLKRFFGLCIDTAHLWTNGVSLRTYDEADTWFSQFEGEKAPPPLLLHLNDSLRARGTGPDAHAFLMKGKIWSGYSAMTNKSGLARIIEHAKRYRTPIIMERSSLLQKSKNPEKKIFEEFLLLKKILKNL